MLFPFNADYNYSVVRLCVIRERIKTRIHLLFTCIAEWNHTLCTQTNHQRRTISQRCQCECCGLQLSARELEAVRSSVSAKSVALYKPVSQSVSQSVNFVALDYDRARVIGGAVCLSLSVRPSVTSWYHVKTNTHGLRGFYCQVAQGLLVFCYQLSYSASQGNPLVTALIERSTVNGYNINRPKSVRVSASFQTPLPRGSVRVRTPRG